MNYSDVQKAAISQHEGQVILISCPGSGKTSTVVARVADMVEAGIDPSQILVVTFTSAAAAEMKERYLKRVSGMVGADQANFSTIHSFCFTILRLQHGYTSQNILSPIEAYDYVSKIVYSLRRSGEIEMEIRGFKDFINSCIAEISKVANNPYHDWNTYQPENLKSREAFHKLYSIYQEEKHNMSKIDFDDMLVLVNSIFDTQPSILVGYQLKYRYLIVDEYQDTNFLQRDLLYKLAGDNPNICVVGDDDQSIYRFRGAKPEIMLGFKKTFPECRELYMDVNYRSEPEIVHAARCLISHNKERFQKDIKAFKTGKGKVKCLNFEDRDGEYRSVTDRIKLLHKDGVPYENMAILFRNNEHAHGWAAACMGAGIPSPSTERTKQK